MRTIELGSEDLKESANEENRGCPSLTFYPACGTGPAPAVIVCPGGSYQFRASHEGEPVARWLNKLGIAAFVLNYRVSPNRHPIPLQDARRAVRTVRHYATEWNLDPERIGMLGFSAGGHLASAAGTLYDDGDQHSSDPVERQSSRPDVLILCYPVITFGEYGHQGSRDNLLGLSPDEALVSLLSTDKQVTADTPPTFLWHAADDGAVPVENSLLFAGALSRHQVPFALHVFENGGHGIGLAEGQSEAKSWPDLCETWLRKQNF